MRTVVISRENTDYARTVEEYLRDFKYQTGHDLEVMNPDTPDGVQFCSVYDIVEYPTIVAVANDGSIQNSWRGLPLPTISELSYYVQ
jgi:hypothetical protein